MIKRTIYLGRPAYAKLKLKQLELHMDETPEQPDDVVKIPVEDIGVLVLDHQQITITHGALAALVDNNVAVVTCDGRHHPTGLLMPLCGHTVQQERFEAQIAASQPLKKQLWAQTIQQKILNQAAAIRHLGLGETAPMLRWAAQVKSGDPENMEARAAAYYWGKLMAHEEEFTREADGIWPNAAFNYAYAIVRAVVARSLVGAGLLPTLGIHHHNRYNAYCLADDIMEPYRPVADMMVHKTLERLGPTDELTKEWKAAMLKVASADVMIDNERSPLMVATQRTATSLARCYQGTQRKMVLPTMIPPVN